LLERLLIITFLLNFDLKYVLVSGCYPCGFYLTGTVYTTKKPLGKID